MRLPWKARLQMKARRESRKASREHWGMVRRAAPRVDLPRVACLSSSTYGSAPATPGLSPPARRAPVVRAGIAQHAQPLAIQFREGHMGSRGVRPASGTAYQRCPVQAAACMHKASVPGSAVAFSLPQSCPRRKFSGNTEIFLFQENFPETRKVQKCYQKSPNSKSGNLKI